MMAPDQERVEMEMVAKYGKKRTIAITVDYIGGPKGSRDSYMVSYHGEGVKAGVDMDAGEVDCPGPSGKGDDKNKFLMRFVPLPGRMIDDVSFGDPNSPKKFDFVCGEKQTMSCDFGIDNAEFGSIVLKEKREMVQVVNRKENSGKLLAYRFKLWITHEDDTKPYEVSFDPRIINR